MKKILITGALGQIGTDLVIALRKKYGMDNIIVSNDVIKADNPVYGTGPFEIIDVMDKENFLAVAKKYKVDTIIHLASLLSATAEKSPLFAWELNMGGLINALEIARELKLQIFIPSSIGAFGPTTPKVNTPQNTIQRPTTMYGVCKVAGELLADYYYKKYNVDARGLRFPGLIGTTTMCGGGTTDYAVDIFYKAVSDGSYVCPVPHNARMDMMYMSDAIQAIIDLMEVDGSKLVNRNAYNVSAMNFTPEEIAKAIQKEMPEFKMSYEVNPVLEAIANSWPDSLDYSAAQKEWGFKFNYDLTKLVKEMLKILKERYVNQSN